MYLPLKKKVWISKQGTLFKVLVHLTEFMFSDTKNRTGMAGSGKAVSSIVEFLTFHGGYWWETCGAAVSKK